MFLLMAVRIEEEMGRRLLSCVPNKRVVFLRGGCLIEDQYLNIPIPRKLRGQETDAGLIYLRIVDGWLLAPMPFVIISNG